MASLRTALISSGMISGVGLAKAKIIGLTAIVATMSRVTIPAVDKPKNISAPTKTSAKVRALVSCAYLALLSSIARPKCKTPFESATKIFSRFAPMAHNKSKQESAAAPAPEQTILISPMFLLTIFSAFNKPAPTIIEVPCWSS